MEATHPKDPTATGAPGVLIDCDPGHDDAVMLALAAVHARVVGITTVCGNVDLHHTTRNALAIAQLVGLDVPVHAGAAAPLDGSRVDAAEVHGATGMDGTTLPEPARTAGGDGPGFLLDASAREEGLWLVSTGPLTNVAIALQRDPGFARRLAGISLMGGSALGGNVTAAAEFNVYADPEAASIVFSADCPVRMSGLDVTRQFLADDGLVAELRALANPVAAMVAEVLAHELERFGAYATCTTLPPMHDPVALLAVTHPHLVEVCPAPITVETSGTITRGATVVDRRLVTREGAPPPPTGRTEWVHAIDAAGAHQVLVRALASFG